MGEMTKRARRPAFLVILALAVAAPSASVSPPAGPGYGATGRMQEPRPLVAYVSGEDIVVADRQGAEMSRTPREVGGFSLGGHLLTMADPGRSGPRTLGLDARTGEPRFRITETLLPPTALRRGKAVAFMGRGNRDPCATSLWLRERVGRERRLIRFSFGGSPGVPTGMTEGSVLDYSFSEVAAVVAVAAGDDIVNLNYDIWTVEVATGEKRRLTRGLSSRYPAMSPGGERVAYFREDSNCGGPLPGYREGDLVLVDADGTGRRVLHEGNCDQYLTRPRWLTRNHLVAVLHTLRDGENPQPMYDSQVVIITDGGFMSRPVNETQRVGDISVSPSARRIAYNDWTQAEGFWVFRWRPDSGMPADQKPWAQGSSAFFDTGRAPHLRGDPTFNPAY